MSLAHLNSSFLETTYWRELGLSSSLANSASPQDNCAEQRVFQVVPKPLGYVVGEQLRNFFDFFYSKLPSISIPGARAKSVQPLISAEQFNKKEKTLKLSEQAISQEAKACLDTASKTTDDLQAAWAFKSAYLLDPHPTKFPFWNAPSERYTLAATSWETLADICLTHKKGVSFSFAFPGSQDSRKPKYLAAKFYQNAAYSIRNANLITKFEEKKYNWNDLDTRRINLLDKSISALETQDLQINDFVFNAEYFEMLAGLYQFKINTYKTCDKEAPDLLDLKLKVFEFRKKSAELYNQIVKENPTFEQYYYNIALNLKEAALHVNTVGEAAELLERAADAAATFRESRDVPLTHPTGGENDEESDAYHILVSHWEMDKLLQTKGPDQPLPERK